MTTEATPAWRPHKGQQERFHRSPAFEVLYGGAAGGGKSESLLMEALRFVHVRGYRAVIFRRTYVQLALADGLIDRSRPICTALGGRYNEQKHRWTFPSGATLDLAALDLEKDKEKYQGAQYAFIGFDELTHFTETQYTYLFSRARTTVAGLVPRIRASTNPGGPGHEWVKARFLPHNRDLHNVVRIITRKNDSTYTRQFIPARVTDNPALMVVDPDYMNRLLDLSYTEQMRLLEGDWDIAETGGVYHSEWFTKRYRALPHLRTIIQSVDGAWKTGISNDYSVIATWGTDGIDFYLIDIWREKVESPGLESAVKDAYARYHPSAVYVEDAASGIGLVQRLKTTTPIPIIAVPTKGISKIQRAEAVNKLAEAGKVLLPEYASWVKDWLGEHIAFPTGQFDDQVDTTSLALSKLSSARTATPATGGARPNVSTYTPR